MASMAYASVRDTRCVSIDKGDPYGADRFSHGPAGHPDHRDHRDRSHVRSILFYPVWFVLEGEKLSLLPVKGSNTDWYKNLRKQPSIRLKARGKTFTTSTHLLTDEAQVGEVAQKFRDKYGAGQVKAYYPKLDVAVEVPLE